MADAVFKDVPELFEHELGQVLMARTESLATFRELGPPDLCHVWGKVVRKTSKHSTRVYRKLPARTIMSPALTHPRLHPWLAIFTLFISSFAKCAVLDQSGSAGAFGVGTGMRRRSLRLGGSSSPPKSR